VNEITVKVHEIAIDGLPDMETLVGRVAFIFDGCVVSGWPLTRWHSREAETMGQLWEADSDVGHGRPFSGVTHWLEFPEPVHQIERHRSDVPATKGRKTA
jgi:hypothetical protein